VGSFYLILLTTLYQVLVSSIITGRTSIITGITRNERKSFGFVFAIYGEEKIKEETRGGDFGA
jgi:type III secretory pathway component EscS